MAIVANVLFIFRRFAIDIYIRACARRHFIMYCLSVASITEGVRVVPCLYYNARRDHACVVDKISGPSNQTSMICKIKLLCYKLLMCVSFFHSLAKSLVTLRVYAGRVPPNYTASRKFPQRAFTLTPLFLPSSNVLH